MDEQHQDAGGPTPWVETAPIARMTPEEFERELAPIAAADAFIDLYRRSGWTQKRIADHLGCHNTTINGIVKGRSTSIAFLRHHLDRGARRADKVNAPKLPKPRLSERTTQLIGRLPEVLAGGEWHDYGTLSIELGASPVQIGVAAGHVPGIQRDRTIRDGHLVSIVRFNPGKRPADDQRQSRLTLSTKQRVQRLAEILGDGEWHLTSDLAALLGVNSMQIGAVIRHLPGYIERRGLGGRSRREVRLTDNLIAAREIEAALAPIAKDLRRLARRDSAVPIPHASLDVAAGEIWKLIDKWLGRSKRRG
jgi:hypothetical protein